MTTYWQRLQRLNPNAKRYLVSTVFRAASFGVWSLLFNLYLISMGFDAAFIGLNSTLLSVASMTCSLPAGVLADRIGRKRAMTLGLLGMALAYCGTAAASQGWLIAASNVLLGALRPLFLTSVAPFLTENSSPQERAILFTFDAGLMNLSMFVASTAGGYLPGLFAAVLGGGAESTLAYRGAMWVAAAAAVLTLLPILGLKPTNPSDAPRSTACLTWRFWECFSSPGLLARLTAPRVVIAFGAGLLFPFLNLFYKERFGVSDAALGWVFGITSIFAAAMVLVSGVVAERWGNIRAMLVARTISTPLLLLIGFVPSFPVAVAAHWVRSGLMRLGEPLYMAFAMERLEEGERATGSSLMGMSWDVGWSTGPLVGGLMLVRGGFGPIFITTMVFYVLSLVLVYRFFGRR